MHVIGVRHFLPPIKTNVDQEYWVEFERIIQLLSRTNLKGKTVAFEIPHSIEYILEQENLLDRERDSLAFTAQAMQMAGQDPKESPRYQHAGAVHFYATLIRYVQAHGGRAVAVEHLKLYQQADKLDSKYNEGAQKIRRTIPRSQKSLQESRIEELRKELTKKYELKKFGRTITFVRQAEAEKADLLITGESHAKQIQLVFGNEARVTLIPAQDATKKKDTEFENEQTILKLLKNRRRKAKLEKLLHSVREPDTRSSLTRSWHSVRNSMRAAFQRWRHRREKR